MVYRKTGEHPKVAQKLCGVGQPKDSNQGARHSAIAGSANNSSDERSNDS
jgi:hypothetical protein